MGDTIRLGTRTTLACDALRIGMSRAGAEAWAGLEPGEMAQLAASNPPLAEEFRHAEADAEYEALEAIRAAKATEGRSADWHSAAWLLEHRWPERWGLRDRTPDAAPTPAADPTTAEGRERIQGDLADLPDEVFAEAVRRRGTG